MTSILQKVDACVIFFGMLVNTIKWVFYFGPLIFAFGFLAPLTAQLIRVFDVPLPGSVTPLMAGLAVAAIYGGVAQWRGRWV